MTGACQLDEAALPGLLRRFYARVRADAALGPLFDEAVHDWDGHLLRLADFWSSVLLTSGRYKGNPLVIHLLHARRITPAMFARWLELWAQTTDELLPAAVAATAQAKARRIARSLQTAIQLHAGTGPAADPET